MIFNRYPKGLYTRVRDNNKLENLEDPKEVYTTSQKELEYPIIKDPLLK
jgi:hypothetical protein